MPSDLSLQHDMHIKFLTPLRTFGTFGTMEVKRSLYIVSSVPN